MTDLHPVEPAPERGARVNIHGRRQSDHLKWWILVIGCLFQGGNYLIVRELMARDDVQRNAERALEARQHADMMEHLRAANATNATMATQIERAVDVLQAAAGATARPGVKAYHPRPERATR